MQGSAAKPSQRPVAHPADLAPFIDHTLLRADAREREIEKLCAEACRYSFKAVCVNPIFVRRTRECIGTAPILTASVIGFPLGANLPRVQVLETQCALADGAAEIDMVIRLDLVKSGRWAMAEAAINEVVRAAGAAPVKVILETGLLTTDEITRACKVSENAGAAFVKTATGFLGRGATVDDVLTMRRSCSMNVQIKASGGVKTFAQAQRLIAAGATRLGTSSGVALVTGSAVEQGY